MSDLYTEEDVKAAFDAYNVADGNWDSHEGSLRAALDAVAPAIAARTLREVAADLRDGAEKNPFTEGGRQGILIAADVCEERATALAEVTA